MKIERKYMAHFLNAAFGSGTDSYVRLGDDLEEYSPELSANVEKKTNILGQTSVIIDSYQKQGEVAPYYAKSGDALFEKLQAILDGSLALDDLKTDMVEVKLWQTASTGAYPAVKEEVYIEIVSYGGDTTGYQIPFNVHYTGVKTTGTFNPATKTFTAS
ncbi:MAG: hypothetical protein ACI4OI_02240 [Gemmiger sp.]